MSHPFPSWIPPDIVEGYKEKGINNLFDWQKEVIDKALQDGLTNSEGIPLQEKNVVYTAPTSAGKSLVAELLAITVLLTGRRVLFVLPYISVAREKYAHLQRILRRIDLTVAAFFGPQSAPPSGLWSAAVCTIEKANSLVNSYIQEGEMDQLGLVVVDELHMVGDSSRGATLDALVTKLSFAIGRSGASTHLVGMSATLGDAKRVAEWMKAELITATSRPVDLDESIMVNGERLGVFDQRERPQLAREHMNYGEDTDKVAGLSISSFLSSQQVLVFCSSKAEVEKTATLIAKTIDGLVKAASPIRSLIDLRSLLRVKIEVEKRARHLDPLLLKTLPRGVAFHHAGLTSEERECIEGAFSTGAVRVLVATSTLSSGVNLPAQVVIIRAQTRGPAAMTATTYRQMAGRAGRLGQSDRGESIVVCGRSDLDTVMKIVRGSREEREEMGRYEKRDASKIVVESIGIGLCSSLSDISSLLNSLLFPPRKNAREYVEELEENKLLSLDVTSSLLSPTQLGRAALSSSLPPDAALFVFSDLRVASRAIALDTELHMLYLVTPVNYSVWSGVDWHVLHRVFTKLEPEERNVARLVGVTERFILRAIGGMTGGEKEQRNMQIHLRFFSSLALFDVVNEMPLAEAAAKYSINRGSLQALQYQSATYAAMVVSFCSRLGWFYLRSLLDGFSSRLSFGIRAELTELVRIEGMDGARARAFHQAGITSMADLAQSTTKQISQILTSVVPFDVSAANDGQGEWLFGEERCRLEEGAERLRERAEEILTKRILALGVSPDLVKFTGKREMKSEGGLLGGEKKEGKREEEKEERKEELKKGKGEEEEEEKRDAVPSLPDSGYSTDSYGSATVKEEKMEEENDLLSQSMEDLSLVDETETANERLVEIKDQEEEEEEKDERVDDLETSLRRAAEVLVDSFDESLVFLDREERRQSIVKERRRSELERSRILEKDSFDESLVFLEEEDQRSKRRSVLGELIRREERRRSSIGVKREEIKDQEEMELKTGQEYDSFYDESIVIRQTQVQKSMEGKIKDQGIKEELELKTGQEYDSFYDDVIVQSQQLDQLVKKEEIKDQPETDLRTGQEYDSFLDDSIVTRQRASQVDAVAMDKSMDKSAELFDDSVFEDEENTPPTERIEERRAEEKESGVRLAKKRRKSRLSLLSSSSPSTLRSPTTASPLSKQMRRGKTGGIRVEDVCSSPYHWNRFISLSREWKRAGLSIGTRMKARSGEEIVGLAITEEREGEEEEEVEVFYVPLSDESIYGNADDEAIAATSTPMEMIGLEERKSVVLNLLRSLDTVVMFDGLRTMEMMRGLLKVDDLPSSPLCLSYLAFLAHFRRGEGPMGVHEIASSLSLITRWQPFLSSSSPRLKAAGGAWLSAMSRGRLYDKAVSLSSKESVDLEMKSVAAISRMSGRGFRFGRSSCDESVRRMRERMEAIEEETGRYLNGRKPNLESPVQVAEILFTTLGLPYPGGGGNTNRRHLPTNKVVLEQIVPLHPLPGLILEYRRLKHAVSQCVVPLRESLPDVVNGEITAEFIWIHTRFNLFSATGRVLSSRPNIQNVGKDPVLPGFSIRSLFVPSNGFVLLSADFCQLELRVLAHLSGDKRLRGLLNDESIDIFTNLAKEWEQERQTVKVVCYGMIYGMGARSLGEKLECTKEQAQKMINNFFGTFPKARSYIQQTNEEGMKRGYVETQLGRRRPFSSHGDQESRSRQERQSINFTIQGTASEIFKSAILAVEENIRELDGRIVMQVHDEIIVEIPKGETQEQRAIDRIHKSMESAFPQCTVRLPVRVSVGKSWAELK